MSNYAVVIFKDKSLKKILKEFITFKKAKTFFDDLLKKSAEKFPVNGKVFVSFYIYKLLFILYG